MGKCDCGTPAKCANRLGAVVADGTQVREVSELDEFVCQVDGQKSEALQLFAAFEMVFILSTGNLYPPWHHSMYLVRSRRANTCRVRRGPTAASGACASMHCWSSADLR